MKEDIKLIALDLDGTLVSHEGTVSEANEKAVKEAKEQGIHVVLSTGRSLSRCRDIAESLGRSSYIVTINGGEIYDHEFELVEQNKLHHTHVERLWELKKEHGLYFWSTTVQGLYNSQDPFENEVHQYDWLKFGFDIEDDEVREVILEELNNNEELEVTNSSPTNIEINPVGVNKAAALKKVCKWLDLDMSQVMAVGDSLNDMAMIKEAGLGVAMGNAQEDVKKAAAFTTATNAEDGVARAIEKVLK
ncbi:Cof-type HAD-IIB family hydrolase [Halobacillus sp. ACCC02827]|uniref:Cof-type HAD-IIB family hydrolase n=1 Tax=Halobacillus sp. ACCC02827 TaxID=3052090 RepID=UPI00256FD2C1|nr:Cof-type HAD-IIB family hydrolase [Halobacillus sp. ACCC02827]WJE15608.1 Cof-type HAD-IIB family hydrolase [Halobacillus sp. ACCC02827]